MQHLLRFRLTRVRVTGSGSRFLIFYGTEYIGVADASKGATLVFRGFLAVTEMALRTFLRDKAALFWGIAFPLMFMGLIGGVFGRADGLMLRTSVVKTGDNAVARGIADTLKQVPVLQVVEEDEATALEALRKGDRSLVVILPDDRSVAVLTEAMSPLSLFQKAAPGSGPGPRPIAPIAVKVYFDEARAQVTQAGTAVIREVVEAANRHITARPEILTVTASGVSARHMDMFDFLLPGILAMVIMQTGLMGVTWVISNYRERRVLKRVLATPFPPIVFLSGMVARFTVTNLLQGAVVVAVGVLVFKATVLGSYLNLFILAVLGSMTFLTMGFAVSTVSKTAEAANTLGSAVGFPMMFLSGTFWPKEMIPEGLQPIISILPLTPLVDAMRGVAAQGEPLAAYTGGMLYLAAWMVVSLAIATWRFRWE